MKATKAVEVEICDFCGESEAPYKSNKCLGCGKSICDCCKKTKAQEFQHDVYCSGSGDGIFCLGCIQDPVVRNGALFMAYIDIRYLRLERIDWEKNFNVRESHAVLVLKEIRGKMGLR